MSEPDANLITAAGSTTANSGADGFPFATTRSRAETWTLVLTSQGISAQTIRTDSGYAVVVASEDFGVAQQIIALWAEENRPRPTPAEARLPSTRRQGDFAIAYAVALLLLGFHLGLERYGDTSVANRLGSANAYYILRGELWRTFTALTLHKDLAHALGNTLIGGLFLASLSGRVGAGIALSLALASGALGNFLDAIHHQTGHNSIGASTAVFGVVGLLCGVEAWRRQRLALPWRGAWVPIGAGIGLLAMLGSGGPQVDFGAHVYGLLCGMGLGFLFAPRLSPEPPSVRVQVLAGFLSAVVLAVTWLSAWLLPVR